MTFGALTILSGARVLFGGEAAQAAAGNAVPFVLWFNFLSGFAYVLAGIGITMGQGWAGLLALALVAGIATVFAFFGLHMFQGGAFEMRTAGAMTLRLVTTDAWGWRLGCLIAAIGSSPGYSESATAGCMFVSAVDNGPPHDRASREEFGKQRTEAVIALRTHLYGLGHVAPDGIG